MPAGKGDGVEGGTSSLGIFSRIIRLTIDVAIPRDKFVGAADWAAIDQGNGLGLTPPSGRGFGPSSRGPVPERRRMSRWRRLGLRGRQQDRSRRYVTSLLCRAPRSIWRDSDWPQPAKRVTMTVEASWAAWKAPGAERRPGSDARPKRRLASPLSGPLGTSRSEPLVDSNGNFPMSSNV
jgi:hypothetical protein